LQRTPVPPAIEGAWIGVAEFFDWHGRPQDVDLEVYQQLSASVYGALVCYIADAKVAHVLSGDGAALPGYSRNFAPPEAPLDSKF
jgi:hypothetical protein